MTEREDEREALARITKEVSQRFGGPSMAEFADLPPIRKHYSTADAILAAGFSRVAPTEPGFCDQCSGPFEDKWLVEGYGGHWDTCPNRVVPASRVVPVSDEAVARAALAISLEQGITLAPRGGWAWRFARAALRAAYREER